jgi:hypothetical protein
METPLTPAEKCYMYQKKAHKKYYEKNSEKIKQTARDFFQKIKDDPVKYAEYLHNKKLRYLELRQDPEYVEKMRERGRLRYQRKKEQQQQTNTN